VGPPFLWPGEGGLSLPSAGVSTCVLCHVLYTPYLDVWGGRQLKSDVATLFGGADRVLVTVVPGLEAPRPLPEGTAYVGPICHPDPASAATLGRWDLTALGEPGAPWVLVSLSSTPMGQEKALVPILEALGPLPVRALLTLADVLAPADVPAPANVLVRSFVPHDFVLPYVDLVVCHGGLTTINSALVTGRPLVCIPQGRDQALNSTQVDWCGAGRIVPKDAAPAAIASAVQEVLGNPSFRNAAGRIATESAALGKGARAVELLEALAAQPTNG
jgi:UDP:flavonoid glycosyltransferase YjiC (YdhE family)